MMTTNDQDITDEPGDGKRRRPRRRRLVLIIPAALVVGLAAAIYTGIRSRDVAEADLTNATEQAAKPTVEVVHPTAGAPNEEVVLPGNVQAFTDTPIYARTSGYLKRWYFDIGAPVKQGDLRPRSRARKSISSCSRRARPGDRPGQSRLGQGHLGARTGTVEEPMGLRAGA